MKFVSREIPLEKLQLDGNNPRHPVLESQRDIIRWMLDNLGPKIVRLAKHIVEHGIDLTELPLVIKSDKARDFYTVVDGNRRITALKLLETPSIGHTDAIRRRYASLAHEVDADIPEVVQCIVAPSRQDCMPVLEAKHAGENEGVGRVSWGAQERARFESRYKHAARHNPQLWALEVVRRTGDVDESLIERCPLTSLERLLKDRYVQQKIGITIEKGQVWREIEREEMLKPLARIVRDLGAQNIKVDDIKTKEDRADYIDGFGRKDKANLRKKIARRALETGRRTDVPARKKTKATPSALARKNLVPKGTTINISESRIAAIFGELRDLNVDKFPNSVAVTFRVFLDTSISHYLERKLTAARKDEKLKNRAQRMLDDLEGRNLITRAQGKPFRTAISTDNHFFSIDALHTFVHSQYFHPTSGDLKRHWTNFEPVIKALWSELET